MNNHRIGLPEYSNEDYFNFCANVSVEYIEKGFDITLASFCIHQQDSLAIDKICSIIPREYRDRVSVIEYVNDIDSFLKKFLSSKFIIGTRFHSIILAWKANIPVFPIVYNSKTSNVIQDYGYSGNYADIRHLESVSFDMLEENRNGPIFQCKKLIEKSHMHLYSLNQALHRHNKWEV